MVGYTQQGNLFCAAISSKLNNVPDTKKLQFIRSLYNKYLLQTVLSLSVATLALCFRRITGHSAILK